jgi:hypothetical protein
VTDFAPGARVIVRRNPHEYRAQDVVGEVARFHPREDSSMTAYVDIRYAHPDHGRTRVRRFQTADLVAATPEALVHLAERHEARAAELRQIAAEQTP